jgi:hypothetical protein
MLDTVVLMTLRSYQPGGSSGFNPGSDPLSDPPSCLRDATLMQKLGVGVQMHGIVPSADKGAGKYYPHLQPRSRCGPQRVCFDIREYPAVTSSLELAPLMFLIRAK